jgi:hypothetical protein
MSKSYIVSRLDMYGVGTPVAICKSLSEADTLVESLSAAVPKGVIEFFSRVPVEAEVKPGFRVAKLASALAAFE